MNLVGEMHMGQRLCESRFPRYQAGILVNDAISEFKYFKHRSVLKAGWYTPSPADIALPLAIVRELRRST